MSRPVIEHLASLAEALDVVASGWITALGGTHSSAVIDDDVDAMSDAGIMALSESLAVVERRVQALHAHVANGIGKRSAPELGKDGLARKAGFRSPEKLIAAATGGHPGDARRLIKVGEATAGRMTFSGERAPARHPHVATALERNLVSIRVADAIMSLLDKLACRVDRDLLDEAEETLVEQATGLDLPDVQVILRRAESCIDPDGLQPKIEELRSKRYLRIWEDQRGMINLDGKLDPATGAPLKAAVEALVTAQIRATRGSNRPEAGTATGDSTSGVAGDDEIWSWGDGSGALGEHAERRTVAQLNADALAAIARHALGCEETVLPHATTTVIVRMPLEALTRGTGVATIDGIAQPVDAGTARRMAADAEIVPLVLGSDSEVLDVGRRRRLFTRAQRLALWERDGGCAGCGAPPGMTEAHHVDWWSRGGKTSLDNGVLLCTSCHHTIHAEEWEIRIDGRDVWLIPPAHIDPDRTPRLGGRRRFDYRRVA